MDKKIAGLLGAAAALTAVTSVQAATQATDPSPVVSYRDLLETVPNATEALKADNARLAETPATEETKVAQVVVVHHHHHHGWRRHWRHRHHHHHHHHHG